MSVPLTGRSGSRTASSSSKPIPRKLKIRSRPSRAFPVICYGILLLSLLGSGSSLWFFLTESGTNLRFLMADTLITTQHRHWAQYLIGTEELDKRVARYWQSFDHYAEIEDQQELVALDQPEPEADIVTEKPAVEIEAITGPNYSGQLLIVHDPKMLRIAVPGTPGKGEKVSSMVQRLGAIAGVNAGGFVDPEWKGNGFQPTGLVISGGEIFYNDGGMDTLNHIVGIDQEGRMVAGKYTAKQLLSMNVREAVTFAPKFIVNGVGQIKNAADGWGIAPRTAMAQTADGTILFAIIDGRQPGHSIGATLFDIQNIFLEHGAVTAANLDGGSSTVLVTNPQYDNVIQLSDSLASPAAAPGSGKARILNKPSSEYGERYLPTAWLLFEDAEQAPIQNVWKGLDPAKINPSKW